MQGGMLGYIENKAGLTHGGSGGYQDKIRWLQPRRLLIEIGKPRGYPDNFPLVLGHFLNTCIGLQKNGLYRFKITAGISLGNLEYALFSVIYNEFQLFPALIALLNYIVADGNKPSQNGLFLHNADIVPDIGGARDCQGQIAYISYTANSLQGTPLSELFGNRNQIHGV